MVRAVCQFVNFRDSGKRTKQKERRCRKSNYRRSHPDLRVASACGLRGFFSFFTLILSFLRSYSRTDFRAVVLTDNFCVVFQCAGHVGSNPPWLLSGFSQRSTRSRYQIPAAVAAFRWPRNAKRLKVHLKESQVVEINPESLTTACVIIRSWFRNVKPQTFFEMSVLSCESEASAVLLSYVSLTSRLNGLRKRAEILQHVAEVTHGTVQLSFLASATLSSATVGWMAIVSFMVFFPPPCGLSQNLFARFCISAL